MRPSFRFASGLAVFVALFSVSTLFAQVDRLDEAVRLYEQLRYSEAQQALDEVDRAQLTPEQQGEYDRLQRSLRASQQSGPMQPMHPVGSSPRTTTTPPSTTPPPRQAAPPPPRGPVGTMQPMTPVPSATPAPRTIYTSPAPPPPVPQRRVAPPPPSTDAAPMSPASPMAEAPIVSVPPPTSVSIATGGGSTPLDEMRARDELLWQRAVAMLDSLSTQARSAMAENNYDAAHDAAEQAIQEIEAARAYADPISEYENARQRALALLREVEDASEAYGITRAEQQREEIQRLLVERTEAIERQKQEKIEQLFATADQLRQEQRFAEEAEIYRQVLYVDPANARAKNALAIAEDYASYMNQRDWQEQLFYQQRRSLTEADQALIPYDYEVMYPRNWPEISARREAIGPGVTGQAPEDIELNRRLDQTLTEFGFEEQEFERVIDFLKEQTDINFAVDWEDLEANGIERDRPVTLRLADVTARTVLNEILSQVGGDVRLAFGVGDGLLRIATKQKLDRDKFVLVYDIRDLLVNIPRFNNAAQLDPAQALQGATQGAQQGGGFGAGGGGGGGAGGQLFQGGAGQGQQEDVDQGALVERIMEIIRDTVEPDSWRETGGGDASLRELNGQLIAYNTSDAHRQVQSLLAQLRETRALQIALEARYLNVTSNFLEEIGVDLDFVFNSGSAGFDRAFNANGQAVIDPFTGAPVLIPRPLSRIGTIPAVPGFGTPFAPGPLPVQPYGQAGFVPPGNQGLWPQWGDATPITAQQGSLALTDPASLNTTVPGSFAGRAAQPALNIAGSILDNLQVDFLIRATQANGRSSIVQAPRILMFNGQRANITVGRARTYVASLNPILAEQAVGVAPVLNVAQSGVVLDVEGTISADRKYVTVTVITTQSEEPNLQRFEVQSRSGSSPSLFVTLLDQSFVTINTTVSIPDGGTILLGGLKQAGEIEVEAGVPILSKIPILKRAFTNSTVIKDTRTLLILMKAKILIQREQEEEAFPTFASETAG